jgi:hypothetical protein
MLILLAKSANPAALPLGLLSGRCVGLCMWVCGSNT